VYVVERLRDAYLRRIKLFTPRDAMVNPMVLAGWTECYHPQCKRLVRGRDAFVRVIDSVPQPGAYCSEACANAT